MLASRAGEPPATIAFFGGLNMETRHHFKFWAPPVNFEFSLNVL